MDYFKYHSFNDRVQRELKKEKKYMNFPFNELFSLSIWRVINPFSAHKLNYYENNHHRVVNKDVNDLQAVLELAKKIIDADMEIDNLQGNVLFSVIIQQRFNYSAPINYLDICWFL